MFKLKGLDARGIAHNFLVLFIVLGVAAVGTFAVVASHADTGHKYQDHIISATCSSITASGHDDNFPNNHVQLAIYDNTDGKWLTDKVQVAGGGSDTYTWPASQFLASDSRVASPTANATITVTEHLFDTINNVLTDEVLSTTTPAAGDVQTTTFTLAACVKAPAVPVQTSTPKPAVPTTTTGGTTTTTAAATHKYSAYIVQATCKDIEVEGADTGTASDGKFDIGVTLSGGPYANSVELGPALANDAALSGGGSTYHHWVTPDAILYAKTSQKVNLVLVATDNGTKVTATVPAGKLASTSMTGCLGSSAPGAPKATAKPPANVDHQYEAHMTLATCNNIEAEADDIGAQAPASPTVKISIIMVGGPFKTSTFLPAEVANLHTISGNGNATFNHWATPAVIKSYAGTSPIYLTLVVSDGGKNVSYSGNSALTLGACKGQTNTAGLNIVLPGFATQAQTDAAAKYCDTLIGKGDIGASALLSCETSYANLEVKKSDAKILTPAEINQATAYCSSHHPDYSTQQLASCVDTQDQKEIKAAQASPLAKTLPTDSQIIDAVNTCLIQHPGFKSADLTGCIQQQEQKEIAATKPKPLVFKLVIAPVKVEAKAVTSTGNFFKNLVGHGTPCTNDNIGHGDNGSCVRAIQVLVNHANGNTNLPMDASYDSTTVTAIKAYQSKNGLASDGVTGPLTWAKLCSDSKGSNATVAGYSVAKTYKDAGCTSQAKAVVSSGGHKTVVCHGNQVLGSDNKCHTPDTKPNAKQYGICLGKINANSSDTVKVDQSVYNCALLYGTSSQKANTKATLDAAEQPYTVSQILCGASASTAKFVTQDYTVNTNGHGGPGCKTPTNLYFCYFPKGVVVTANVEESGQHNCAFTKGPGANQSSATLKQEHEFRKLTVHPTDTSKNSTTSPTYVTINTTSF